MRTLDPRTRTRALAAFLVAALRRAAADELPNVAKAVAFGIFFAIPSAMLVALGLFGLVASPGGIARTVDRLHGVIPASVIGLVQADLTRVAASRSGSIGLFVGGLALALWSLTGAMTTLMWGLNAAHELSESRGFVRRRLDALALVGCSMAAFVLVFAVLVLGPYTAHWVGDAAGRATLVESLWRFAEWPLAALPLLVIFAAILSIGPDLGRGRLRAALPGAAWTTVAWLVVSTLFGVYAANYGRYDRSWGSLGAVIVALTWIWLSSLAVLIGAEVNAEIVRRRAAGRECTRGSTNPDGRHGESRGGGAPPVECPAMGSREAACSCGQLRLEATGDP
ncbi:MAG TPA: YihY/virulence factor BrkB family protein, partial [Gaiellales bacterium]|nr:YihY/virulence factor BrkB family protein [Gaiellales bacterium]